MNRMIMKIMYLTQKAKFFSRLRKGICVARLLLIVVRLHHGLPSHDTLVENELRVPELLLQIDGLR